MPSILLTVTAISGASLLNPAVSQWISQTMNGNLDHKNMAMYELGTALPNHTSNTPPASPSIALPAIPMAYKTCFGESVTSCVQIPQVDNTTETTAGNLGDQSVNSMLAMTSLLIQARNALGVELDTNNPLIQELDKAIQQSTELSQFYHEQFAIQNQSAAFGERGWNISPHIMGFEYSASVRNLRAIGLIGREGKRQETKLSETAEKIQTLLTSDRYQLLNAKMPWASQLINHSLTATITASSALSSLPLSGQDISYKMSTLISEALSSDKPVSLLRPSEKEAYLTAALAAQLSASQINQFVSDTWNPKTLTK
ncbi:MAG: hypothetical protein K2X01_02270 [Cyanobacteria bacterium]|nr:hypothetical protein [Cyanobacteriota bacterium]